MATAKAKMDYLKLKGKWGAKSPNNEKIVAMAAKITALKGKLKLNPKLSAIAKEGKKKGNKGKKGKKWKNKKNTSNKKDQKRDEMWKRVPPKDNEKKEKQVGKYTYNWCKHHMTWTVHKPSDCKLGKKQQGQLCCRCLSGHHHHQPLLRGPLGHSCKPGRRRMMVCTSIQHVFGMCY
jgi:hypothetical protein